MIDGMQSGAASTVPMSRATSAYDAIVIGAGLNGLTTAAYLSRGGMRVLVLERRATIGGSTVTEEFAPGFSADVCRHDVGAIAPRLVSDLDLERHGLKLVSRGAAIIARGLDDSVLEFGPGGPSIEGLRRLSPSDAAKWPKFAERVNALTGFLTRLYAAPVPGVDASSFTDIVAAAKLGLAFRGLGKHDMVELLRVLPMSISEWLDDWFKSPLLKGALASRGIMHVCQGPRAAGTAFNFLHHNVGHTAGALARPIVPMDGAGALAHALAGSACACGTEIRVSASVARIITMGGAATGVVLASGEEISARRIVSGASPRHTFLELCDPSQLAPEFVSAVRNVRYRGVWAKVNLAVERMPAFNRPAGGTGNGENLRGVVVAPTLDYLERAYDDAKYGRVSARPFLDVVVGDAVAGNPARSSGSTISIHLQYAPYRRRDGAWDAAARTALGELAIAILGEREPQLKGLVRHTQVFTPFDLEEKFGLPEGHAYHGEIALDQSMFMRPVPECSHYATPVRGLFVCGSGAHPGGGIAGGVGMNAARTIIADAKKSQ